jgi:MFS family permease
MATNARARGRWLHRFAPPPGDLLRDAVYRRLWTSILISSFGGQVTMLALPLTAAVLLQATSTQMGLLSAVEIAPFVLFSLPGGVWLDRVRKLPVYVAGELLLALIVATVPLAWVLGRLTMEWLYLAGFAIGTVYTIAGSAAQIVLTQIVPRSRLVEAHAKNALASAGADVAGPGFAGLLIKTVGAPLALLVDAVMLLASALILRGIRVHEPLQPRAGVSFRHELAVGLRFVAGQPLLRTLAALLGGWQMCHYAALTVQILFATRTLGLSESAVGFAYVAIGGGTVLASAFGHAVTRRLGPGPSLLAGFALCGAGWLLVALLPVGPAGVAGFALMLFGFGVGAVLVFINFLALRQSVTPQPLLGRMTSTMRWLTLLPAGPGALLGGWLGDAFGLRAALAFAGGAALLLALLGWRRVELRGLRELPRLPDEGAALGGDGPVQPAGA